MLNTVQTAEGGAELAAMGQKVMNALASSSFQRLRPSTAIAWGEALTGTGLQGRVATNAGRTKMALPEVMLRSPAGAGGTRRLPRLVGLATALDMMLTGKNIRPHKALKMA